MALQKQGGVFMWSTVRRTSHVSLPVLPSGGAPAPHQLGLWEQHRFSLPAGCRESQGEPLSSLLSAHACGFEIPKEAVRVKDLGKGEKEEGGSMPLRT